MAIIITHAGKRYEVPEGGDWQAVCESAITESGKPWDSSTSRIDQDTTPAVPSPAQQNSTFSFQVSDEKGRERAQAQQDALKAAGVTVDASQQAYATGTRMADSGYAAQTARSIEHGLKQPLVDVAHALVERIKSEKREQVEVSARDFAAGLSVNGKLAFKNFSISEAAIRGLLARVDSPSLGYVLGLRERIADTVRERCIILEDSEISPGEKQQQRERFDALIHADKQRLLETLAYEAKRNGDVPLLLRTRNGNGLTDVFAVVAPGYGVADAPDVIGDILDTFPTGAKGTFSYDPITTAWELRGSVWTPTPIEEQVVGEVFEGYITHNSRDNGTRKYRVGGGFILIRCLNATTYLANANDVAKVHRKGILVEVKKAAEKGAQALHTLIEVWGQARKDVIPAPVNEQNELVPFEDVIPGLFRGVLTDRRSELVGVLPGRREEHVAKLAVYYGEQRRDTERLVRSDLAQAWTRYAQDFATPVRRDAESAIGSWLASGRVPRFEAR